MADIWTDRLSEYIDDELTPAERIALESHLKACRDCTETIADLRAVAERARHLPGRPPAADLWPDINRRIGGPLPFRARALTKFSFTLPQLVAAGLALMVMSAGGMWVLLHGGRATSMPPVVATNAVPEPGRVINAGAADQRYEDAIADLQHALDVGRSQLDAATIATLETNLKAIDTAIAESQRALAQDQDNVYLNNHLAAARQRKLALLRRATALVGGKT